MKNITETILDNVCCYKVSHRGKHIPHDGNHNDLRKRTYQQVSIIYLRTIRLNHGPKSKVSFSVPKTAMTYVPPTIPGSNSIQVQPFSQKARRERIVALKKNWETVPCSFIPFKEVWFSEASNKGFSAHTFQYITWAVDLHFFFNPSNRCEFTAMLLLHPQVTRLSSRLNDVAWHYATPQVRSQDIIKFQRRVHFLDKCFVHFS